MSRLLLCLTVCLGMLHAAAQPGGTSLSIQMNIQHATCGATTGGIVAWVSGGVGPYTFMWSPTPASGQGTASISGVLPGTYTLTVTDSDGTEVSATGTVVLTPNLFPTITDATAWSCEPGCGGYLYYYAPLTGPPPFTVNFDPAGPVGGASPNGIYFSSLCIGETYDVTVSDGNGCTGTFVGLEVVGPMNPTIVNQTITPSCPDGATGGFTIEFNSADSVTMVPGQGNGTLAGSTYTASNLAPGSYTLWVSSGNGLPNPPGTSGSWCSASFVVDVPVTTDPCGTLSGVLYADLDADCSQGTDDPGIPHRVLSIEPGGQFIITDANGGIGTELLYGTYALDADLPDYTLVCPSLPAPFTLDAGTPTASVDVAMEPAFAADASAYLTSGVHRPGFQVQYTVLASNEGPFTFTGAALNLYFDPILMLVENGGGLVVAPGHLQWDLGTLAPFSTASFQPAFSVPANASLIGTQVSCTAALTMDTPDSNPANDEYVRTSTIVGAYDPNDKLAFTSSRLSSMFYYLDADQWIDYTIRFQNTGTAEAINVHLTDTLSELLDIASLRILGASHDFTVELAPGRVLRFDFPGIMLPDSTSNLLGSHGFASFRIQPITGIAQGATLENNADIFFDFNEPVRTNTATLVAEFSTGVTSAHDEHVVLTPNPATDILRVEPPQGTTRIEVVGADARLMMVESVRDAVLRIRVDRLPPGVYTLRCMGASGPTGAARFVRQ